MGAVQVDTNNTALMNMDYQHISHLKTFLYNLNSLELLAQSGDAVALVICIDIRTALESKHLTDNQKLCIRQHFIEKEAVTHIAAALKRDEATIRSHIKGGLRRMRKVLLSGALYE